MAEEKLQEKRLYLNPSWIFILFGYYAIVFLVGLVLAILVIVPRGCFAELDIIGRALLGSIGMACNGSAVFYIRKLYKLCFLDYLQQPSTDSENTLLRRLGTTVYFIARPIFSLGFAVLIVIALSSTFLLTNKKPLELDTGFIYLTMFVSFFGGFLSGHFVKILETKGESVLKKQFPWSSE